MISFKQSNLQKKIHRFQQWKEETVQNRFWKRPIQVHGKTIDAKKHTKFDFLVSTPKRLQKCVNRPAYNKHIINENSVGVEKENAVVDLNTSIYTGLSILDWSKVHIRFYYDVLKPKDQNHLRSFIWTATASRFKSRMQIGVNMKCKKRYMQHHSKACSVQKLCPVGRIPNSRAQLLHHAVHQDAQWSAGPFDLGCQWSSSIDSL